MKRILRYLQGTKSHGICFKPGDKVDLVDTPMQTGLETIQIANRLRVMHFY